MRFQSFTVVAVFMIDAVLQAQPIGSSPGRIDFHNDVRPIFATRCFSCHGPNKQRGGLRLDQSTRIEQGGASGRIIERDKSGDSPLVKHLIGDELDRMPPEGEPLEAAQIETIRRWIDQGASLPADAVIQEKQTTTNAGWAFQPMKRSTVPLPLAGRSWIRTPIDAFVLEKLNAAGLTPSPDADRRTLIRRVSLDLTGLPPGPDEIDAFIADPAADAYERLVDRLLSSPRYGERWARHWLDVAHYADSHGHDQDRPRPNAWPYRDYLLRSLNVDKPYARFVAEQIAGDVIAPADPEALQATGFLAAGPWDESGLRDIQADSIDREAARYLDRDDIVTSTMSTVAGVTVHCARCHDHKFDPIPQEDYYALQAVFAGVDKAERAYDADPAVTALRKNLAEQLEHVLKLAGKTDPSLLTPERQAEIVAYEKARKDAGGAWHVLTPDECKSKHGVSLRTLLDRSVLSVGKRADRDTYAVPVLIGTHGATALRLELLCDDTLPHNGPGRQDNGNLHLSELKVTAEFPRDPSKKIAVKLKRAVADFDQPGWDVSRAIDGDPTTAWGIHPEVGKPHAAVFEFEQPVGVGTGAMLTVTLDQLHGGGHLIGRFRLSALAEPVTDSLLPIPSTIKAILDIPPARRTPLQKAELARWLWQRRLERELASLPPLSMVYCGTNRFKPDGSFMPTPTPRTVHLLKRGEVTKPERPVPPGALAAVKALPPRFNLHASSAEGERRAALAAWLTSRDNPLTWRVIVNRVWHYHFSRGIVDTPNDFGKMGGVPSHPELLDWLAADFRSQGSLKRLHRLILTSSTYRQSVRHDPVAAEKDADNRLLWRTNRTRLDAEAVRDSILFVTGRLDGTMYGPPVQHFLVKPGVHVTPDADYDRYDVDAADARRRSVYRFILRTRPDPLFNALDCPEASMSAPVRGSSLGAPQTLVLWNNKFMLRHAEHLAVLAERSANAPSERLRFVVRRVLGRDPTAGEQAAWSAYVGRHGLANFCRVLFNSSEFLFID
jgi:hypothetical protein